MSVRACAETVHIQQLCYNIWACVLPNMMLPVPCPEGNLKSRQWNHLNVSLQKVNWAAQQKYKCEASYKSEKLSPDPELVPATGIAARDLKYIKRTSETLWSCFISSGLETRRGKNPLIQDKWVSLGPMNYFKINSLLEIHFHSMHIHSCKCLKQHSRKNTFSHTSVLRSVVVSNRRQKRG